MTNPSRLRKSKKALVSTNNQIIRNHDQALKMKKQTLACVCMQSQPSTLYCRDSEKLQADWASPRKNVFPIFWFTWALGCYPSMLTSPILILYRKYSPCSLNSLRSPILVQLSIFALSLSIYSPIRWHHKGLANNRHNETRGPAWQLSSAYWGYCGPLQALEYAGPATGLIYLPHHTFWPLRSAMLWVWGHRSKSCSYGRSSSSWRQVLIPTFLYFFIITAHSWFHSMEDVEVDEGLSFLDDFVQQAVARGAKTYLRPSERSASFGSKVFFPSSIISVTKFYYREATQRATLGEIWYPCYQRLHSQAAFTL